MSEFFPWKEIITPKITQRIFKLFKNQRLCLPFMARWIESLDFSDYDLVVCSSSWFAHWAITKPECKFIVYYHAPARYMWDWTNEYKKEIWANRWLKWYILNKLFLKLRIWDFIASKRSDIAFANSSNTQSRITKYHRKDSIVLYPPIETTRFQKVLADDFGFPLADLWFQKGEYYIIISALTEFKRLDVAIEWFKKIPQSNLIIIWDWEHKEELIKLAWDSNNICFVWPQYWDDLVNIVQNSKWLIFPWEEDFWMVPVEALAAWKPVFALKKWGLLETVTAWITWDFFHDVEWEDFVERFEEFNQKNNDWIQSIGS